MIEFCRCRGINIPTIVHVPPCILPGYEEILDNYMPQSATMMLQDKKVFDISKAHQSYSFKESCRRCVYFRGCTGYDLGYVSIFGDSEFKAVLTKPPPFYSSWRREEIKRLVGKIRRK